MHNKHLIAAIALVVIGIVCVVTTTTFADTTPSLSANYYDDFFGPVVPNNTMRKAIIEAVKVSVKESKEYTDQVVAGGAGSIEVIQNISNRLDSVTETMTITTETANSAKDAADAAAAAVSTMDAKFDNYVTTETAASTYQPKGDYITELEIEDIKAENLRYKNAFAAITNTTLHADSNFAELKAAISNICAAASMALGGSGEYEITPGSPSTP